MSRLCAGGGGRRRMKMLPFLMTVAAAALVLGRPDPSSARVCCTSPTNDTCRPVHCDDLVRHCFTSKHTTADGTVNMTKGCADAYESHCRGDDTQQMCTVTCDKDRCNEDVTDPEQDVRYNYIVNILDWMSYCSSLCLVILLCVCVCVEFLACGVAGYYNRVYAKRHV